MAKFALFLYDRPADYAELSPEQMKEVVKEYRDWARRNKPLGGEKLAFEGGRILRRKGRKLAVIDGPYAEAKEVLGGYFIVKAASYAEAVEIAKSCPHAKYGAATHIRQIDK